MIHVFQLSDRATDTQRVEAMMGYNEHKHAQHCGVLWAMQLYDRVAIVDADHLGTLPEPNAKYVHQLERAYMRTNTIENPWYAARDREIEVARVAQSGCRSTSVGDVLVVGVPGATGSEYYVVASMGFYRFENHLTVPMGVAASA